MPGGKRTIKYRCARCGAEIARSEIASNDRWAVVRADDEVLPRGIWHKCYLHSEYAPAWSVARPISQKMRGKKVGPNQDK